MIKRLLIIFSIGLGTACTSDSEQDLLPDDPDRCSTTISFQNQIDAILTTNCNFTGCHNGDNGASRNWTIFSNVQNNAQAIRSRTTGRTMPPANTGITLSDGDIDAIACWVEQGAQNN